MVDASAPASPAVVLASLARVPDSLHRWHVERSPAVKAWLATQDRTIAHATSGYETLGAALGLDRSSASLRQALARFLRRHDRPLLTGAGATLMVYGGGKLLGFALGTVGSAVGAVAGLVWLGARVLQNRCRAQAEHHLSNPGHTLARMFADPKNFPALRAYFTETIPEALRAELVPAQNRVARLRADVERVRGELRILDADRAALGEDAYGNYHARYSAAVESATATADGIEADIVTPALARIAGFEALGPKVDQLKATHAALSHAEAVAKSLAQLVDTQEEAVFTAHIVGGRIAELMGEAEEMAGQVLALIRHRNETRALTA